MLDILLNTINKSSMQHLPVTWYEKENIYN